jgi:hypothetical protein
MATSTTRERSIAVRSLSFPYDPEHPIARSGDLRCEKEGDLFKCANTAKPRSAVLVKRVDIWPSAVPLDLTGWDRKRQDAEIQQPMMTFTAIGNATSFVVKIWPGTRCDVDAGRSMACKSTGD